MPAILKENNHWCKMYSTSINFVTYYFPSSKQAFQLQNLFMKFKILSVITKKPFTGPVKLVKDFNFNQNVVLPENKKIIDWNSLSVLCIRFYLCTLLDSKYCYKHFKCERKMNLCIPYFIFECTTDFFFCIIIVFIHAIYFQFVIRFLKKHFVTLCLNADLGNKIQESTQHCWPSWQPQTDIRYISYPFWLSALHNKIGLYAVHNGVKYFLRDQ